MPTNAILVHLKRHGQLLDSEIATATGITLPIVRASLTALATLGEISLCSVTRFNNGESNEGMLCRVLGYIPPATPGRKPRVKS